MLYAEDLEVGRIFPIGSWELTTPDITRFATDWDPMPIHTDEAAATAGHFGGLIASGLHTLAVANRLAYDHFVSGVALHVGRELRHVRLLRPVRPGTTLEGEIEILEQRLRDDGLGVVAWQNRLTDEQRDSVLEFVVVALIRRRPAS